MKDNKKIGMLMAVVALALEVTCEQVLQPTYWLKSLIKVTLFFGTIALYSVLYHQNVRKVINLHKMEKGKSLLICMVVFFVGTLSAFLLFQNMLDLENIKESLLAKENLTRENCLFVFGYIILVNSFLEESFFRGFVSGLGNNRLLGNIISAVLFSLYHIGIFITWFNPFIFCVCLVGLAIVGLFLQWLCERHHSILASYLTHGCANLAINCIGVLLIFGFIG